MEHPFEIQDPNSLGISNPTELEPIATTLALGEEGGDDPIITTQALGEEGGIDDPIFTTLALGEEGGEDPIVTTQALGEEGGEDPIVTTLALGEEGGEDAKHIQVTLLVPDNLNERRQFRLARVLDRVAAIFGEDAVSPLTAGRQEILITSPLAPDTSIKLERFLKRLKRILGDDNVLDSQKYALGTGHPFEIPNLTDTPPAIGSSSPLEGSVFPAIETDNPTPIIAPPNVPGL